MLTSYYRCYRCLISWGSRVGWIEGHIKGPTQLSLLDGQYSVLNLETSIAML